MEAKVSYDKELVDFIKGQSQIALYNVPTTSRQSFIDSILSLWKSDVSKTKRLIDVNVTVNDFPINDGGGVYIVAPTGMTDYRKRHLLEKFITCKKPLIFIDSEMDPTEVYYDAHHTNVSGLVVVDFPPWVENDDGTLNTEFKMRIAAPRGGDIEIPAKVDWV